MNFGFVNSTTLFSNFTKGSSTITSRYLSFNVNAYELLVVVLTYETYFQIDAIYNDEDSVHPYWVHYLTGRPSNFYYYRLNSNEYQNRLVVRSSTVVLNTPVPKYSNIQPYTALSVQCFPVGLNKNFFNFSTLPQ